jgi:hypothetical protein
VSATSDINSALRVYLGDEHGGYQPIDTEERLRRAFPTEHDAVRAAIEPYLKEEEQFDYPASAESLAAAGDIFAQHLRAKFPELDPISVRGLANRFTFAWK